MFGISASVNKESISFAGGSIVVTRSLIFKLGFQSHINTDNCRVVDPAFVQCKFVMTKPDGTQQQVGTITSVDVWAGANCVGDHTASKDFEPLGALKGRYVFHFSGVAGTLHPKGRDMILYPTVQIIADGKTVVDQSYPAHDGANKEVSDSWVVDYS
jgi:hypothetical protein